MGQKGGKVSVFKTWGLASSLFVLRIQVHYEIELRYVTNTKRNFENCKVISRADKTYYNISYRYNNRINLQK